MTQRDKIGKSDNSWEVHKFGGTSVASAECFLRVARIVEQQQISSHKQLCVVVSAMGGKPKVTDLLLGTVAAAAQRKDEEVEATMQMIMEKHAVCLDALDSIPLEEKDRLKSIIQNDIGNIRDILKTVSLMKWQAMRISELVAGYGEIWSAQILSSLLDHRAQSVDNPYGSLRHRFQFLDARRVIVVEEDDPSIANTATGGGAGGICWETCSKQLTNVYGKEWNNIVSNGDIEHSTMMHFVATGYVASNSNGVATTLGRDGSDYSAAIFGRLLTSDVITIWTDVDGVLSADPRRVPNAHVLPDVSFNEAMELAFFGAKVIHPKTMTPAIMEEPQIPIYIRNTFNSSFRGTRIFTSSTTHLDRDKCVCGFSTIEDISLINVEGSGMVGVPGVAKRLFGTLESNGVNVILIAQASSEHSITFATMSSKAAIAKAAIEEEFAKELRLSHISDIDVISPCSIIAAVGDGMGQTTGVSGRFFSALGDAKINIMAMAQGCSERNISAVILTSESTRALRAVHAAFRLSQTVVRVGLIISDELGYALLDLLQKQRNKIRATFDIDIQVCAAASVSETGEDRLVVLQNKHKDIASLDARSVELVTGRTDILGATAMSSSSNDDIPKAMIVDGGFGSISNHVLSEDIAHTIIFDCTGNETVGRHHPTWLRQGIHVITANNTCLSGPRELREEVELAERLNGKLSASYLREVTVGGGLPIVSTIRNLLNSGDKIRRIDGILSVSLSYIMYRVSPPPSALACVDFDQKISKGNVSDLRTISPSFGAHNSPCSFSQALNEAITLGLMESDPIRDLSNEYTARCLMVLAKELGMDNDYDVKTIQKSSDNLIDCDEDSVGEVLSVIEGRDMKQILSQLDDKIGSQVAIATGEKCVLRHVFSIDVSTKSISISLLNVPESHIFAITPPSCECVRFFTERHKRYPLIIKVCFICFCSKNFKKTSYFCCVFIVILTRVHPRVRTVLQVHYLPRCYT